MLTNSGRFPSGIFDEFQRLRHELDQLFNTATWPSSIRSVAASTYPPVNIGMTPEQVDVYVFAAGLDPDHLDINIQQNLLTIAGQRKTDTRQGVNYYRKERFDGEFRRVLTLPDDVDPDRVEASYRDGVLRITVQRSEQARPRRIEVQ